MNFLLDEQLSHVLAQGLSALGDRFTHIYDLAEGGASDDEVVRLCRDNDCQVLVSLNVRDFGARRYYYGALLDEGIHVVVGRWTQKGSQPDNGKQLSLFAMHYQALKKKLLSVEGPTLIMVTQSSIRVQDLSDLVERIESERPALP